MSGQEVEGLPATIQYIGCGNIEMHGLQENFPPAETSSAVRHARHRDGLFQVRDRFDAGAELGEEEMSWTRRGKSAKGSR